MLSRFGNWDLGFGVWGLGFGVWVSGFRVEGSAFQVSGFGVGGLALCPDGTALYIGGFYMKRLSI